MDSGAYSIVNKLIDIILSRSSAENRKRILAGKLRKIYWSLDDVCSCLDNMIRLTTVVGNQHSFTENEIRGIYSAFHLPKHIKITNRLHSNFPEIIEITIEIRSLRRMKIWEIEKKKVSPLEALDIIFPAEFDYLGNIFEPILSVLEREIYDEPKSREPQIRSDMQSVIAIKNPELSRRIKRQII